MSHFQSFAAFVICALTASLLVPFGSASAGDVHYDGTQAAPSSTFPFLGNNYFHVLSSGDGPSDNNVTVTATGGADFYTLGGVFADERNNATGSASRNTVVVSGDRLVLKSVMGGYAAVGMSESYSSLVFYSDASLTTEGNSVFVSGAYMSDLFALSSFVSGGNVYIKGTGTAKSSNNRVVVVNSTVRSVYGGNNIFYSDGNFDDNYGEADYNEVYLDNVTVLDYVYGGQSTSTNSGTAVHNTVTLKGATSAKLVQGGRVRPRSDNPIYYKVYDDFTGNTLNIVTPAAGGITVADNVRNFEYFNFLLDPSAADGSVVLDVGEKAFIYDAQTKKPSKIASVGFLSGEVLPEGHTVVLMHAGDGIEDENFFTQSEAGGFSGVNILYNMNLVKNAKTLSAVVGAGTRSNPQMESPSQGREAGLLMVSEGLDLIVGQNLNSAVSASPSEPCPGLFFDAAYGRARYGAGGGDVDLASFSGLLGAACSSYLDSGVLTMGGFVELGRGSYDVKLDLGDRVVRGDGDLRRIGGGVLARFEFDSRTNKKFYLHSSLRGGRLSQDYQSPDLLNSQNSGRHDTSSMYVAGHLGLGAEVHLAGGALLDFYARYGHTYLKGADAMVDGTAPVNYKAAVSSRARAGGRYAFNLGERARLQLGLGYDHEFDARTKATTGGLPVNTPDMSGGSAVAEINAAYLRPGPVPVSLSIGLEGFMGRRKGVVGSLKFTVAF